MGDFVTIGVMGGQQIASAGKVVETHLNALQFPVAAANAVILLGVTLAYLVTRLAFSTVTWSAAAVLLAMLGLGAVGFLDDFLKVRRRRSLGLSKRGKLLGQAVVAVAFVLIAALFVTLAAGIWVGLALAIVGGIAFVFFGTTSFLDGLPVALDGTEMALVDIIPAIAEVACRNGVGIMDHIEDRVVGMQ